MPSLLRSLHVAARVLLVAAALGAVLADHLVQPAWAQSPRQGEATKEELAAARQMFREGLELEKSKRWGEALKKFERVAKVKLTSQVRFHVALCQEHVGRFVEAINGFELAEQEARAGGPTAKSVAENAPKRAAALRERIGFVLITVTGTIRTSKILLDGRPISEGVLDTNIPVDPGLHSIVVDRDDETVSEHEVKVGAKQVKKVRLTIDDPEPPPEPEPGERPVGPGPDTADGEPDPSRMPAYLVGGIGLATMATGGIFWVLSQLTIEDIRPTCDTQDQLCDYDKTDQADQGQTFATVGNVLVPVGGVGLAAGIILFIVLSPNGDEAADEEPDTDPTLAVVPTLSGVQIIGSF